MRYGVPEMRRPVYWVFRAKKLKLKLEAKVSGALFLLAEWPKKIKNDDKK